MKIFDSHFHIIDSKYPLNPNHGFIPEFYSCVDYLNSVCGLEIIGGAIVSGSYQGFDQLYLEDAIQTLGDHFVGVTQLPSNISNDEIFRLDNLGVRALRFNVTRGGSEDISNLDYFSRRVFELVKWPTELYIHSDELANISAIIARLPAVSIDHLGLSKSGFPKLLSLVNKGVRVKATGFGRIDFDPSEAIRKIYSINPDALMFGTDLPSTRAKRPFRISDIDLICNTLDEDQASKVLFKNALNWYRKSS